MKPNQKSYLCKIRLNDSLQAAVICVTYSLLDKNFGAEFYQVMTFGEQTSITIPSYRQATFQEELRSLHTAAAVSGDRTEETKFIIDKLKEAYGSNVVVECKSWPSETSP